MPLGRVAVAFVLGLPVLALLTWWQLLGASYGDHGRELPAPVWRRGDPCRGCLVALQAYTYDRGTVVALPGDRLREEPSDLFGIRARLTATSDSGTRSVELYDSRGINTLPSEVPPGSLVVYGEYPIPYGTVGLASVIGRGQVRGTVLDGWRASAIEAGAAILGFAWFASAGFAIGRVRRH